MHASNIALQCQINRKQQCTNDRYNVILKCTLQWRQPGRHALQGLRCTGYISSNKLVHLE